MTTHDMVKLAYDEAPDVMERTAFMLRLLERIEPEFVADVSSDFQKIAERALQKTKTAAIGEAAASFGKSVGKTLAGVVAVGLGTAIATDLYNSARRNLTSGRNWKRMIESNPALKENELGRVRTHFNALQRHAPDVAADPLAAGAAVDRLMHLPEQRYDQSLKEIMDLQKTKTDTMYKPFVGSAKIDWGKKDTREDATR
jgi:hypothetical protein